jgi:hypothetical protein
MPHIRGGHVAATKRPRPTVNRVRSPVFHIGTWTPGASSEQTWFPFAVGPEMRLRQNPSG